MKSYCVVHWNPIKYLIHDASTYIECHTDLHKNSIIFNTTATAYTNNIYIYIYFHVFTTRHFNIKTQSNILWSSMEPPIDDPTNIQWCVQMRVYSPPIETSIENTLNLECKSTENPSGDDATTVAATRRWWRRCVTVGTVAATQQLQANISMTMMTLLMETAVMGDVRSGDAFPL